MVLRGQPSIGSVGNEALTHKPSCNMYPDAQIEHCALLPETQVVQFLTVQVIKSSLLHVPLLKVYPVLQVAHLVLSPETQVVQFATVQASTTSSSQKTAAELYGHFRTKDCCGVIRAFQITIRTLAG